MQRKDPQFLSSWLPTWREQTVPVQACRRAWASWLKIKTQQHNLGSAAQLRTHEYPTLLIPIMSNFLKGGKKTGSGKKNDLESHLLIMVSGEWKTEFPLWSNYSLVSLMKPNHESFQVPAWCFRGLIFTCLGLWKKIFNNFPKFPYYPLFPFSSQKNVGHFPNARGTSKMLRQLSCLLLLETATVWL